MNSKGYTYELTILNQRDKTNIFLFTEERKDDLSNTVVRNQVILENSNLEQDKLKFIRYDNLSSISFQETVLIPKIQIGSLQIRFVIEGEIESYFLAYTKQNDNNNLIEEIKIKRNFSFPFEDFEDIELIPPEDIPLTNFRIWKSPLNENVLLQHSKDIFNWGTNFPLDENYISKEIPPEAEPEFVKDLFSSEFPDTTKVYQPESKREKLLEFALESFMLRTSRENWIDLIKEEKIPINEEDVTELQIFVSSLDPKWDEASQNEGIRFFNENKTEISSFDQPVSDWRFGIEFSPTSSLDVDQMRGLSSLQSISDWVGSPESLYSQRYPLLEDWRDSYFERTEGPLKYLQSMRLHRWLNANIKGVIEKLIPFNVNYLGFNNIIEPHASERAKIKYPGSERHLDPLQRLDPAAFRVLILDTIMRRY